MSDSSLSRLAFIGIVILLLVLLARSTQEAKLAREVGYNEGFKAGYLDGVAERQRAKQGQLRDR